MLGDLPEAFNTGIYEIRNTKNGRRYIGSAVNVSKRWRDHIRQLEDGRHHSRFMQRCWNKNGSDCFIFRVLLACEKNDLLMYEQRAIDTIQPQYNSAPKAGSQLGLKMSDEAKAKMAAAARRTKNFTGCTHSEETKRRISEKKRGVKQNPDVVAKRASSIRALKGRHSAKKFTESQIIEIRARSDAGEKNIVIAREYGVSDSVICEIKNRKAYRWVD
jgi:group I intron endonuclease